MSTTEDTPARISALTGLARRTLANGLRVWVKPRPGTGTVAMLAQVPVGARHETRDNNGISHFVEHMLFTGTARWDETQVMDVIRRRGGYVNARTSVEDTVFWLHLPAADQQLGLEWFGEVLFRPRLEREKFEKERKVILNEKGGETGRLEDWLDWVEDHDLGWNVFRAARYHLWGAASNIQHEVIGRDASLKRLTHADLLTYYRRHYVPNNITLLIVGDCQPDAVFQMADEWLGQIAPGELPAPPDSPPINLNGNIRRRLHGPSVNDQGQFLLTAPLPGLFHPDRFPLLVLSEMLDDALQRRLRYERGLVYGVEVYPAMYRDVGYFVVYTTAESGRFDDIMGIVRDELNRVRAGRLKPDELAEARDAIRGRAVLSMEGNLSQAWWLSEESMYTPDDQPIPDYLAAIAGVTLEDIQRVLGLYLSDASLVEVLHEPGLTPRKVARPLMATGGALAVLLAWQAGRWLRARRRRA